MLCHHQLCSDCALQLRGWEPDASTCNAFMSYAVMLPCFGHEFNQSLEKVAPPSGLPSLTFGLFFNPSLEKVALPAK